MSGSKKQQAAFAFLQQRQQTSFTVAQFAEASGYSEATAAAHLRGRWGKVITADKRRYRAKPVVQRMTYTEFLKTIAVHKRGPLPSERLYVLLDTSVVVPYYLDTTSRSRKLKARVHALFDEVRSGNSAAFLYIPNFCVAEAFGVMMKHRFGSWNHQVKNKVPERMYRDALARFEADTGPGRLLYPYELSASHLRGMHLIAPVDHHFERLRPRRGKGRDQSLPKPAGTFDQLILSMGVHLAHLHGAMNTTLVTADTRLAALAKRCRDDLSPQLRHKLGLDRSVKKTGFRFRPESFPNVVNLQTASANWASTCTGTNLSMAK